ncbi:murein biosynthesis integral membrane protein MurJ [Streptomyces sp. NBC_01439]|uniref:murein biosynthesis integral membrane protein MurJ n=1 Tax=Streptomyces sp. NBC_01439 TaxID=2903867 RepID=UPI002E28D866|nr:lipid II flippase MurJ [Streptomyces sp. NBC_01439]
MAVRPAGAEDPARSRGTAAAGDPGSVAASAAPGFVAGGLPGGSPSTRRAAAFGSAGYPGGASGRHSVRVAASGFGELPEARAGQAGRAAVLSPTPGGSQTAPAGSRLRQSRPAGGLAAAPGGSQAVGESFVPAVPAGRGRLRRARRAGGLSATPSGILAPESATPGGSQATGEPGASVPAGRVRPRRARRGGGRSGTPGASRAAEATTSGRGQGSESVTPSGSGPGGGRASESVIPSGSGPGGGQPLGRFLAKAAAVTAGLTAAGAVFGLVRDQSIAHLFGAGHDSDAFLIAWTVPEMASTLLIEDAMALLMVPAFSHALAHRAAGRARLTRREARAQDPVRLLVGATLPRLVVLLAAVAALLIVAAPAVVAVLAPGLPDPALAVECTRLTALTVLSFGIAGYFSAALRAHRSFLPPAAIYVSYNVGIIGTMVALHTLWGVRAAAAGVAVGGFLMVLVQLPAFVRNVGFGPPRAKRAAPRDQRDRDRDRPTLIAFGVIAPVIFFAVFRQSQVLVERFLAASLPPGAISHLNYAQKVAQMPMVLSLMICTVTFPVVAQAMAGGEREKARRRVEQDLALASLAVLMGTALVIGYAPQIIQVLFERGAFTHEDTLATASVMRVYGLGLLGHCLVGALSRPFFSTARPTWFPAFAMGAGLLVNIVAGAFAVGWWGTYGIAAANAAGITTTAVMLLTGLGSRIIAIQVRRVAASIGKLGVAAVAAAALGWIAGPKIPDPMLSAALGCLLVPAMFGATGMAMRALEVTALPGQISQLTQRFRNVR